MSNWQTFLQDLIFFKNYKNIEILRLKFVLLPKTVTLTSHLNKSGHNVMQLGITTSPEVTYYTPQTLGDRFCNGDSISKFFCGMFHVQFARILICVGLYERDKGVAYIDRKSGKSDK